MQRVISLIIVKSILLLINNPENSLRGDYISGHEHDELMIKLDGRLSDFSDKCLNDLSIGNINLENSDSKNYNFLEYEVDIKYFFAKRKNAIIITDSVFYLCYKFYFKYNPHNILRNSESISIENNFNVVNIFNVYNVLM